MRSLAGVVLSFLLAIGGLHAQELGEAARARAAAIQAFRAAPSLASFSAAGEAIMSAFDLRDYDLPNPKPLPKDRDFEAMKATLAAGVVVPISALPSAPPFEASDNSRVTKATLPQARSSFFKRGEPLFVLALRPFRLVERDVMTVADALSAVNRQPMRVRVAEPMSFGGNGPYGAWDVGAIEARFDQDAVVHAVARSGQVTGYHVRSLRAPVGNQPCTANEGRVIGTRMNPDWGSAIVGWIGRPAPGTAMVTTRQSGGSGVHEKLVSETIDLDRDGAPDLFTLAGIDRSMIVDDVDLPWKAVFVNREGRWTLASYRAEPDCT